MASPTGTPEDFYQTVGFHFQVTFYGLPNGRQVDVRFQSVSGLDISIETESLREGGENRFEHSLPTRRRYTPLILKRGVLKPEDSGLSSWCMEAFQDQRIRPLSQVQVELLNEAHEIMMYWKLAWVWPKSWKMGELNAERGEVLIETLELNYNRFEFKNS